MKEIIKLILKYHFTIIFILLEALSFSLIVRHNNYQRTVFSGYAASVFGMLSSVTSDIESYFSLRETNEKLVAENTELRNSIEVLRATAVEKDTMVVEPNYKYLLAKIVNTSFNKTKNYLTLDKGSENGVEKEMAVCAGNSVVGVVQNVSSHYAVVLPLINTNLRVSAKIKKNGYYGSLQWDGNDYRYSFLNDIPFHVNVEQGDTIVTSGFSSIFPEGELVGFVESVNKETANFLSVKVKLATDFKRISDVYVIANEMKLEKQELEESIHE